MDHQSQEFLDSLPNHPMRSRLEPHYDFIRELRRKRFPYRKIAEILQQRYNLETSKSAVHDFLRVRNRKNRNQPGVGPIATPAPQLGFPVPPTQVQGPLVSFDPDERARIRTPNPTTPRPEPKDDIYAHFEELKHRNSAPPPPKPQRRFHYEEGEPLILIDRTKNPRKRTQS
jgi:hypothetical protein